MTGGAQLVPAVADQCRRRARRGVGELAGRARPAPAGDEGPARRAGDVAPGVDGQRAQRALRAPGAGALHAVNLPYGRDAASAPTSSRRRWIAGHGMSIVRVTLTIRTPPGDTATIGRQNVAQQARASAPPTARPARRRSSSCQPEADAHPGADQPDRHRERSGVPGANLLGHGAIVPATSVGATPDGRISSVTTASTSRRTGDGARAARPQVRDLDVSFWVNGLWFPAVDKAASTSRRRGAGHRR